MKTVTMQLEDEVYKNIKLAADGQKRNISNFIEFATTQYLYHSNFVDETEMENILKDDELVFSLKNGLKESDNGDWTIV